MSRCYIFNDGDNSFNSAWRFMHDLSFKSAIFHLQMCRSEFSYWSIVLADFEVKLKNADGCSCRSCACTVFNKRRKFRTCCSTCIHSSTCICQLPLILPAKTLSFNTLSNMYFCVNFISLTEEIQIMSSKAGRQWAQILQKLFQLVMQK